MGGLSLHGLDNTSSSDQLDIQNLQHLKVLFSERYMYIYWAEFYMYMYAFTVSLRAVMLPGLEFDVTERWFLSSPVEGAAAAVCC